MDIKHSRKRLDRRWRKELGFAGKKWLLKKNKEEEEKKGKKKKKHGHSYYERK